MTEDEQELYLAKLIVKERKARKHLACLESKLRQVNNPLTVLPSFIWRDEWNFEVFFKEHEEALNTDIKSLVAEIGQVRHTLHAIQKDIRKIDGEVILDRPASPSL